MSTFSVNGYNQCQYIGTLLDPIPPVADIWLPGPAVGIYVFTRG